MLISLQPMSVAWERKSGNLEETADEQGERLNSTHREEAGIEPQPWWCEENSNLVLVPTTKPLFFSHLPSP